MKLYRVLISILLFGAFANLAAAANPARVQSFSPTGEVKKLSQVKVRFSTDMIPLGDLRHADPFIADCSTPGKGRWIDTKNWVFEFKNKLPAGQQCTFTPRPGLKDVSGNRLKTKANYRFNTGGPAVRWTRPWDGNTHIAEDQYFRLILDGIADPKSVQRHAWCEIPGMSEKVPVQIVGDPKNIDLPKIFDIVEPVTADSITANENQVISVKLTPASNTSILWLRCQNTLPSKTKIRLIWDKGIQSSSGIATKKRQVFTFTTRSDFFAKLSCTRSSIKKPCSPLSDFSIQFSAPISVKLAKQIELHSPGKPTLFAKINETKNPTDVQVVRFAGPFPENAQFKITLPRQVNDDAGRPLQNADKFPLSFSTGSYPPLIKFSGDFGILEQKQGGVLPVSIRGVETPLPGASISISTTGEFIKTKDPFKILNWIKRVERVKNGQIKDQNGKWHQKKNDPHPSIFQTSETSQTLKLPPSLGGKSLEVIGIPLSKPGFYVVELQSQILGKALIGTDKAYHVASSALVTNMSVHFLWGAERSLVWVTNLDTGRPIAGADIQIGNECHRKIIWDGKTDADGMAYVDGDVPAGASWASCYNNEHPPLIITAQKKDDFSFTRTKWNDGLSPWEFGIDTNGSTQTTKVHTILDRPLFRAGETVSMKHIVRRISQNGLSYPAQLSKNSKIIISHPQSGQSFENHLSLDTFGRAETQWKIPKDAHLGEYQIVIDLGGDDQSFQSSTFLVEEFKIPTMQAFLKGPKTPISGQSKITLNAMVRYLAGGGASGQEVKIISEIEQDNRTFTAWPKYQFNYRPIQVGTFKRGEEIEDETVSLKNEEQKIILNKNGAAKILISDIPQLKRRYTLRSELEYVDANGETQTKTAKFKLWPAALALGIKTDNWVADADDLKFDVLAIDTAQNPISGQDISVAFFLEKNLSWRKRMIGGYYAYENERQISLLDIHCTGKTDKNGQIQCKMKPGISGEIWMQATTKDANGNIATTTGSITLAGKDDWWFDQQHNDRMDLLVEHGEFDGGDTAHIQVRSPFRNATALVTVQREGVIDSFVTQISGKHPIIEVPIKAEYAPNVYISVLAVRGRVHGFQTWLAEQARKHDLSWLSRDGGRPTGLIDLSKPAFRMGLTHVKVGYKSFRLHVDVSTDKSSYAIRQTAKVNVKIKTMDGTPLPKNSEVTLAVIDVGLLQLKQNSSVNILANMMKPRALQVFTSTAQMHVVGKRHYGRKAVAPGGGGSDDILYRILPNTLSLASAPLQSAAKPRELFDTILVWRGTVQLDENGEAVIDVPINDSLTQFEVVAIANGGPNKFGTGKAHFTVTQDVQLISALPPIVRENDLFMAAFTVRNTTDADQSIIVLAKNSTDRELAPITLQIPAGEARQAKWEVLVPYDQDQLSWQISARKTNAKQVADSMRLQQVIYPALPVITLQSTLARLAPGGTWPMARPVDAMAGRGGVEVRLQAKLGAGFDAVDDYMRTYPYSCYEQRTSIAIALNDADRWNELMAETPAFMDADGLLKYYASDQLRGSPTLTAYVLKIADEAGWEISTAVRKQMLNGLNKFVTGRLQRPSPMGTNDLLYRKLSAIHALSRYDAANAQDLTSLEFSANLLPSSALLDWIGILQRLDGIENQQERLQQAMDQLRARLDLQGTRLNFSTAERDRLFWLMESVDANAARTLLATYDHTNWQEDAPRLSLGLIARQNRGRWYNTTANAWAVLAMRKFSDRFEKGPVNGRTKITYGPRQETITWPKTDAPKPVQMPWQDQPSDLQITHQGTGTPWTFISSKAAIPFKNPISAGYQLEREIEAIEQKVTGEWHVGDVMKIRLNIHANSDMSWVVIDDPVPAGATILGGNLSNGSARTSLQDRSSGAWPIFTERKFEAFRQYYRFVRAGDFTVEYTVRLNTQGRFQLPPSHIEAMYAPEMFASTPINELVIHP